MGRLSWRALIRESVASIDSAIDQLAGLDCRGNPRNENDPAESDVGPRITEALRNLSIAQTQLEEARRRVNDIAARKK